MSFSLFYHPEVAHDIKQLGKEVKKRIEKAVLFKLIQDPYRFGKPLQYSLKGARTMRIGDYRVVYVLKGEEIWVLAIIHRKEDYHGLEKRLSWLPR